jgi:hypothetical protein
MPELFRKLELYFDFRALGTNWKTEILAGFTTFVTMAYIQVLFWNLEGRWRIGGIGPHKDALLSVMSCLKPSSFCTFRPIAFLKAATKRLGGDNDSRGS